MAILKNINGMLPFIPGYVVYEREGKIIVRAKGTVDDKKRKTDPAFAVVRKNNNVFGQAATLNKRIRREITPLIANFGDSSFCSNLQKYCYTALRNHMATHCCDPRAGERSIAPFVLRENGAPLLEFSFRKKKFDTVCNEQDLVIEMDSARNKLRWDLSNFKKGILNTPAKATHFRLLLGGLKVPPEKLVFDGNKNPEIFSNIIYKDVFSDAIPLETFAGTELPLCLKLEDYMALSKHDSLLVVAGIVFYRKTNDHLEQMTLQSVVCFAEVF